MPTAALNIQLFGRLCVRRDGQSDLDLPPLQSGAVLAYLALFSNKQHTREELADIFWPEDEPEAARQKLRHALHALRRILDDLGCQSDEILIATRSSVRLNPDMFTTDVAIFEDAIRSAGGAAEPQEKASHLARAIESCSGTLLPGFWQECFSVWRLQLERKCDAALQSLAVACEQTGDLERAIEFAQRLIASDPLAEEAHCTLMRVYASQGQPAAVLRQYQELERTLKAELGELPSESTRLLMDSLRQSAQVLAAAPNGSSSPSPSKDLVPPVYHSAVISSLSLPRLTKRRVIWMNLAIFLVVFSVVGVWRVMHKANASPPALGTPDNQPLWVARYESVEDETNGGEPTALTVDAAGNSYVTGFVHTRAHDVDFLTLKFNSSGKLL